MELCHRLLSEKGIVLLAGLHFGDAPTTLKARLSFVDFDGGEALNELAKKGLHTGYVDVICERMNKGINLLHAWLKEIDFGHVQVPSENQSSAYL